MTKKTKYYWKVVRVIGGKYTSCTITKGKFKTIYKVGQYVYAPIKENGLFVFRTRRHARGFADSGEVIFKVRVGGQEIFDPIIYSINDLEENIKRPTHLLRPEGTCNFPSVMLVEKLR